MIGIDQGVVGEGQKTFGEAIDGVLLDRGEHFCGCLLAGILTRYRVSDKGHYHIYNGEAEGAAPEGLRAAENASYVAVADRGLRPRRLGSGAITSGVGGGTTACRGLPKPIRLAIVDRRSE